MDAISDIQLFSSMNLHLIIVVCWGAVNVHTLCMRVLIPHVYVEGRRGHPYLPLLFLALIFSGGVFLVEHGTCGLIIVVQASSQ